MSQFLNLKTLPLILLCFCFGFLFFFDPSNPALSRDTLVFSLFVWIVCFAIAWKKKLNRIHPFFFLACLFLIGISTINGINRAPVVYFPQKLNLKLLYVAAFSFSIFLFLKNVSPIFLFIHTIAFASSPPLFSSIKSIPVLIFVLASFLYLAPKRIRFQRIHWILAFFFLLALISSILSYKSQAGLLQLSLLLSGIGIFFLISSYPSRAVKKGLLLILSFDLLLNTVNLFSAIHTMWPFSILEPPLLLTYAGFPVSAIAVISAFSALILFYTAFQFSLYSWILIPAGILSIYITFLNHSRASILAFFLAGISFLLLRLGKKTSFPKVIFPAALVLFLVGFGIYFLTARESIAHYLNPETLWIRFSLWAFHFQSVFQSAPVLGLGPDADSLLAHLPGVQATNLGYSDFYLFLHSFRSYPQAHNLYVETYTSFGILGSLVFLAISVEFSFYSWRMLKSGSRAVTNLGLFLSSILVFVAFHEFFDFNLGEQHFLIPVALSASLLRIKDSFKSEAVQTEKGIFRLAFYAALIVFGLVCFQLIWEQRLRNLILASVQNEIELDNFLIYKEKNPSENRKKKSYPTDEIVKNEKWIRSEESLVLASFILRKKKEYEPLSISLLARCIRQNPYSSVCRKEKAALLRKNNPNLDIQKEIEEAKKTDPFHIIFTE
ncbi:O-antigen ligase family protein [Leptospira sp. 201903070]|uniref:O-antigen ligase family protein n=1 Tax=Leptospira ainlahdjerensis TaxID=2810033 RepID=A0ABS2UIJ5_9LEPT|nr:O-antigen ligase family protein [Leptospira ainlahdjerensis]MBM9578810.1 O-antigen ligase family protein [Leptospira ainlahdjerensis]